MLYEDQKKLVDNSIRVEKHHRMGCNLGVLLSCAMYKPKQKRATGRSITRSITILNSIVRLEHDAAMRQNQCRMRAQDWSDFDPRDKFVEFFRPELAFDQTIRLNCIVQWHLIRSSTAMLYH